jgi:hypothetical protein
VPDAVRAPLERIGMMVLPPSLAYRVWHWDELDAAEREVTAADVDRLAGVLASGRG